MSRSFAQQPLKVLLAVHHFPPTRVAGAEQFAYRLARGLIERGHAVQVVCVESIDDASSDGQLRWSDEVYNEIPVRRLYYYQQSFAEPLRASFANPLIEAHLTDWLVTLQPDVVHLISGYLIGMAPLHVARQFGIPSIVTLTDFWFLCPTLQLLRGDGTLCEGPVAAECARCLADRRRRVRWLDQHAPMLTKAFWRSARAHPRLAEYLRVQERLSTLDTRRVQLHHELNVADVITSPTQFVAALHRRNGINRARVVIIPYAVDGGAMPAPRAVEDEIHFGFLGQIAPIKGVEILIRAFRQIPRTRRRARLFIHGAPEAHPAYARRLRALAHDDPNIVFAGRYDNRRVMEILADLDAIVVPSLWYENSPTVALEAFAARRPVIGTDVGGIAEIVEDGVNGLLFERGNVAALARQMQRVLDDAELLPRLRAGIPRPRSPDEEMNDWLKVYAQTLAQRQPARSRASEQHV